MNAKIDYRKRQTAKRIWDNLPFNAALVRVEEYGEYPAKQTDITYFLDDTCQYIPECMNYPGYGSQPSDLYVLPPYMSGGDYGNGGSVSASNARLFLDEFAHVDFEDDYACGNSSKYHDENGEDNPYLPENGIIQRSYGYGGYAVAIRLDVWLRREDIQECIAALDNYPCIDDEDVGRIEMQWADDNWDCWAKGDFLRALQGKFGDFELSEHGEENFREYFESMREDNNTYWESEGGHESMHVDITSIVSHIQTIDQTAKYGPQICLQELTDNKFCDECNSYDCGWCGESL